MSEDAGTENEADDNKGDETSQDKGASQDGGDQDKTSNKNAGKTNSDDSEPDERKPDWMSDRVWKENFSKTEGDLNMEDVAKWYSDSYANATKQLHTRKETLAEKVKEELNAARFEGRPEAAKDYKLDNPEILKEAGLAAEVEDDDPALIQFKNWAYEQGLSQEQFDDVLSMHFQGVTSFFPNWDTEKELLGENADARVAHLNTWMSKVLSPEAYKAAERMAVDAEKVILLEELSELSGNVAFTGDSSAVANTAMSREDVLKLMDSDEYRSGDKATLQKVQNAWTRITQ